MLLHTFAQMGLLPRFLNRVAATSDAILVLVFIAVGTCLLLFHPLAACGVYSVSVLVMAVHLAIMVVGSYTRHCSTRAWSAAALETFKFWFLSQLFATVVLAVTMPLFLCLNIAVFVCYTMVVLIHCFLHLVAVTMALESSSHEPDWGWLRDPPSAALCQQCYLDEFADRDACAICFQASDSEPVYLCHQCRHWFHSVPCITQWARKCHHSSLPMSCPTCRAPILPGHNVTFVRSVATGDVNTV